MTPQLYSVFITVYISAGESLATYIVINVITVPFGFRSSCRVVLCPRRYRQWICPQLHRPCSRSDWKSSLHLAKSVWTTGKLPPFALNSFQLSTNVLFIYLHALLIQPEGRSYMAVISNVSFFFLLHLTFLQKLLRSWEKFYRHRNSSKRPVLSLKFHTSLPSEHHYEHLMQISYLWQTIEREDIRASLQETWRE